MSTRVQVTSCYSAHLDFRRRCPHRRLRRFCAPRTIHAARRICWLVGGRVTRESMTSMSSSRVRWEMARLNLVSRHPKHVCAESTLSRLAPWRVRPSRRARRRLTLDPRLGQGAPACGRRYTISVPAGGASEEGDGGGRQCGRLCSFADADGCRAWSMRGLEHEAAGGTPAISLPTEGD